MHNKMDVLKKSKRLIIWNGGSRKDLRSQKSTMFRFGDVCGFDIYHSHNLEENN
jgi:hypothetical protein